MISNLTNQTPSKAVNDQKAAGILAAYNLWALAAVGFWNLERAKSELRPIGRLSNDVEISDVCFFQMLSWNLELSSGPSALLLPFSILSGA